MLHIYNSLSRKKERFQPIVDNYVQMYVCGMTVYDLCHLGHARMLVVFDMVTRYMRSLRYQVKYVRNITDIDDKIIVRAHENEEAFSDFTERFIEAMHEDAQMLNLLPPDLEPRATAHITDIIDMISTLFDNGYAYQGELGDVYYRVRKFDNYGALSGKNVDEMRVGARIEADQDKEDPLDFVLWKSAKPDEPKWDSPWGEGRPGWHIECSAMSTQCLGNSFDIHGGGHDLQFPHHENEIAQSEGATGEHFVNLWMHNGFVQIDKEKMSKSLGNFFTIREILAQDENQHRMGEAVRFMMLISHYRSPLNYSGAALENARTGLARIYKVLERAQNVTGDGEIVAADDSWVEKFQAAMNDDFNTPEAVSVIFDLARQINRQLDNDATAEAHGLVHVLRDLCDTLGIATLNPTEFLGSAVRGASELVVGTYTARDIDQLLEDRRVAKQSKDWASADQIRAKLTALGLSLEDHPDGTTSWRA